MKQENVFRLTFIFICLYNLSKNKKIKHMRKKELSPDLLVKKNALRTMAENMRKYKKDIIAYQQELITTENDERKNKLKGLLETVGELRTNVSKNYRHLHVAYCELRGTSRSMIEKKNRLAKPLDQKLIDQLSKQFSHEGISNEEAERYLNG
jgi:hypothetical protein